jgi:hypothetical protein
MLSDQERRLVNVGLPAFSTSLYHSSWYHPPRFPQVPYPSSHPSTHLRPPIRRIPKRPQQHRYMIMLPFPLPPHHKLNLHLRKERLDPPLPKICLRIKRQTPPLVPVLVKQGLELDWRGEGGAGAGRPGCYAPIGIGCRGESYR